MISFVRDILKCSKPIRIAACVTAFLWLVSLVLLLMTVHSFRVKYHYEKACRFYHQGNIAGTITEIDKALAIDADFAEAHNLAGKLALEGGNYDKAAEHFARMGKVAEDSQEAANGTGVTEILRKYKPGSFINRDGLDMMKSAAERSVQGRPLGDLFVNLGSAELHEGRALKARDYYAKALDTRNVSMEGLVHLYNGSGVVLTRLARFEQGEARRQLLDAAAAEFEKAALIAPASRDVKANRVLLDLVNAVGKPPGVRQALINTARELDKSWSGSPSRMFRFALYGAIGMNACAERKYEDAVKAFEIAGKESAPPNLVYNTAVARLHLAEKLKNEQAFQSASDAVKQALELGENALMATERLGLVFTLAVLEHTTGYGEQAKEDFAKAEMFIGKPGIPKEAAAIVYRALAIVNYEDNRIADSLKLIDKALDADPTMTDLKKISEHLKTPPAVSRPEWLSLGLEKPEDFLPPGMWPMVAEVYGRATVEPLKKDQINVTIQGRPAEFEFAQNSRIIILPMAPLTDGLHTVEVTAIDSLKNTARNSTEFRIDTTPPTASISPASRSKIKAGPMTFTVELHDEVVGVDHSTISILVNYEPDGQERESYTAVNKGKYSYEMDLEEDKVYGGNPIASDKFGFQLKYDLVPGKVKFIIKAADVNGNKMPDFAAEYTIEPGEEKK